MAIEFELKFRATDEAMDKIRQNTPGQETLYRMQTTYYDTPEGALSARHCTLRQRMENQQSVCTLKTPAQGPGRNEFDTRAEDIRSAWPELCKLSGLSELSLLDVAVMTADPIYRCWEAVCDQAAGPVHTIYLSPCGKTFRQEDAIRLSKMDNLILVCGHYEGIDQRFIDECVDEEISLGDFVLTGGEIAAMAVTDAVCRMVPGVLADPECFEDESHFNGMLEYPQYSRPAVWHNREVPQILLSGNHEKVAQWRRKQSIVRTRERRPDMYEKLDLSGKQDQKLLKELEAEEKDQLSK